MFGRIGALEVVDAYLLDPASPSAAAVYLTVRNTGHRADQLVGVSSPVASSSMLMTEDEHGSSGTMKEISSLAVPAHGEVALAPGHYHAMLGQPSGLVVGHQVPVTLRFAGPAPSRSKYPWCL